MDMGSSRFIPAVRGESAGRDKDADIALLLKYSYELPDFLSRCRRFPVLNLRLDTGRLGAQGVAIRDNIHTPVLPLGCYERRVVPHAAQQRGDKILKLVRVLRV